MFLFALPLLLAAVPPTGAAEDRRIALMDRIETAVTLPRAAYPFAEYGRYYAFDGPGRVRSIYLRRPTQPHFTQGCEIADAHGSRKCTQAEVERRNVDEERDLASYLAPGQRRWVEALSKLPVLMDGGCMVVAIEYDIATERFLYIACHGIG